WSNALPSCCAGNTLYLMVPPDAFSTSAPQSSIAFCNGCVGGTQCESLSSTVLSSAEAAPIPSARPRNTAPHRISIRRIVSSRYCDWLHFELFPFKRISLGVYRNCSASVSGGAYCLRVGRPHRLHGHLHRTLKLFART